MDCEMAISFFRRKASLNRVVAALVISSALSTNSAFGQAQQRCDQCNLHPLRSAAAALPPGSPAPDGGLRASKDASVYLGGAGPNGILYHGGAVITEPATIYLIWYGAGWDSSATPRFMAEFVSRLGNTPWMRMNHGYADAYGNKATADITYKGAAIDTSYSAGSVLSDEAVLAYVDSVIRAGKLPYDPRGHYFVMASKDVTTSTGFCTTYCGWHNVLPYNGRQIGHGFVGDTTRCPDECQAQDVGPNAQVGLNADGMASILAHEIAEALTDPYLDAWFATNGQENADICAWHYGDTFYAANGAIANLNLGGTTYLIQQNWVNANGGYCGSSQPVASARRRASSRRLGETHRLHGRALT